MNRKPPLGGPPQRAGSGWTLRSFLLLGALLAVSGFLVAVGKDTLQRGTGDPMCEAMGVGAVGLAVFMLASVLLLVREFGRVELSWDGRGVTCRAGHVQLSATWHELREVESVPFAHARFSRPVVSLRGHAGVRRLVLRRDDRTVVIPELFFPDFQRLLQLLADQRARVRHW